MAQTYLAGKLVRNSTAHFTACAVTPEEQGRARQQCKKETHMCDLHNVCLVLRMISMTIMRHVMVVFLVLRARSSSRTTFVNI